MVERYRCLKHIESPFSPLFELSQLEVSFSHSDPRSRLCFAAPTTLIHQRHLSDTVCAIYEGCRCLSGMDVSRCRTRQKTRQLGCREYVFATNLPPSLTKKVERSKSLTATGSYMDHIRPHHTSCTRTSPFLIVFVLEFEMWGGSRPVVCFSSKGLMYVKYDSLIAVQQLLSFLFKFLCSPAALLASSSLVYFWSYQNQPSSLGIALYWHPSDV